MTNGEVDRLGERIMLKGNPSSEDLDLLQEFRKSYKDSLSKSFEILRNIAIKVDKEAIVTFRIKRIDTIIRKLERFKNNPEGRMPLSRMWDIAGCRCIFNTNVNSNIYKLKDKLLKEFGECKINDHIITPKPDGYTSLHLYVHDKAFNKRVEIQIRTTKQHNWATLVEIIDLIYNTKIKEGEQNNELKKFLYLFSKKESLSKIEKKELIKIERKFRIFKKMSKVFSRNYLNIRKQWISMNKKNGSFYVIEANKDLSSTINLYQDFENAEEEYYKKYTNNTNSNIVLTYIKNASFKQISKAYSNYVLSMHSFFDEYKKIIETQIIENLQTRKFIGLWKILNIYRKTTCIYLNDINSEIKELRKCYKDNSIKKTNKREWENDLSRDISNWQQNVKPFLKQQNKAVRKGDIYYYLLKVQYAIMAWQVK